MSRAWPSDDTGLTLSSGMSLFINETGAGAMPTGLVPPDYAQSAVTRLDPAVAISTALSSTPAATQSSIPATEEASMRQHAASNQRALLAIAASAALALLGCASAWKWDGKPVNDLPNPYRTAAPWGKLPEGRKWGALSAVAVDNDGRSVWVVDRCGANPDVPPGESAFQYDSCAGSSWAPVHKLDAEGNIVKSFGAGLFVFPHKIYQDAEGNVWVVDMRSMNKREQAKNPNAGPAGHTVVKFDPNGKVLM